ncbi:hypothetical protein, partial [Gemmobacter fulva]|uniref:hypothetical protein n=1 Tax=Gemmobacter fulvus TaxID=2840474 RepID=UPI001BFFFB72
TPKRPNRPHISSDIINVKEHEVKKTDSAPFLQGAPPIPQLQSPKLPSHHQHLSADPVQSVSVRQLLGPHQKSRKRKNAEFLHFLHRRVTQPLFHWRSAAHFIGTKIGKNDLSTDRWRKCPPKAATHAAASRGAAP